MDMDQFTNLLQRHAGLIHKVAYAYCRDSTDREDVVQEITMRLWQARYQYDERFQVTTWIYRVAINAAISFYRRQRRHHERRVSLDECLFAIAVPSSESNDELELLTQWIDALNELDKALVLLYLDGHNHASIAEVLGISPSNVGTKLQRIKIKLNQRIQSPAPKPNSTEARHAT